MNQPKNKSLILIGVLALVVIVAGFIVYINNNKADASIIGNDGTACPYIAPPGPDFCGGNWVASTPNANNCPMPPTCLTSPNPSPTRTSTTSCTVSGGCTNPSPTVTLTSTCGVDSGSGIALPCASPPTCPQLMPMQTGWCTGGQITSQPNDTSGCPQPPICIKDSHRTVTLTLNTGWNAIVIPEYMFEETDPISTDAFTSLGYTVWSFNDKKWEHPTSFRRNGSYFVKNYGAQATVTVKGTGAMLVGSINSFILKPGWNLVANNESYAKAPSNALFVNNTIMPNCNMGAFCNETKTLAELFNTGRLYDRIYFINDTTSSDPNVFYKSVVLSSSNLNSSIISANSAYWVYLRQ